MKRLIVSFSVILTSALAIAKDPVGLTVSAGYEHLDTYYHIREYAGALGGDDGRSQLSLVYDKADCDVYRGEYVQIVYDFAISECSAIVAGARYSNLKMYKDDTPLYMPKVYPKTGSTEYVVRRSYLTIPIKYQYTFNLKENLSLYANAGSSFDCLLSYTVNGYKLCDGSTGDDYKRVNILLGGEVGIKIGRIKLSADYDRYMLGTNKVAVSDTRHPKEMLGRFSFGIGYTF